MIRLGNLQFFAEAGSTSDGLGDTNKPEQIALTQDELNQKLAKEKGTGERAVLKLFGLKDRIEAEQLTGEFIQWREGQKTESEKLNVLQEERNEFETQAKQAVEELMQLKNEKLLISKGVKGEDADYIAFRVSKLITDEVTFEQAAERYLKDNPKFTQSESITVALGAHHGDTCKTQNINDQMNAIIRGAK